MGRELNRVRKPGASRLGTPESATDARREALALFAAGAYPQAERLYLEVMRRNPKDFDAIHMLGVLALRTGRAPRGLAFIERALRLNPHQPQANANLGNALMAMNRPDEAIRAFNRALRLDPCFSGALANRSAALQSVGRHEEAADSFFALLDLVPDTEFALGEAHHARRSGGDWREFDELRDRVLTGVASGRRVARPLPFLAQTSDATRQRDCARIYHAARCAAAVNPLWQGERYGHARIRLAYVSADFRGHAVLNLIASMLERHSRKRFETLGVALTPADGSAVVRAARRNLGDFVDATALSDVEVARLLRSREVDIAVDLTGYTQGARPGVFSHRMAPVQVNFVGYPGTLGSPHIDYLIADDFVVPAANSQLYDESIVRLPDTFQPNSFDRLEASALPESSRRAAGLPESARVLCCFNNGYKLTPEFLSIWARVLRAVPETVLWLLGETPAAQTRLRAEAAARGIDAARLVFAPRVPYLEHLSRLRLADLYLDTLPFNAGATASDVLWAGLPILTCAGEAFAGRMAGSLLRATDLAELITHDLASYEQRAIRLATDPEALARLRSHLLAARSTAPLYDSARFCRHLEAAYEAMWQRAERGEAPTDLSIAALDSIAHPEKST